MHRHVYLPIHLPTVPTYLPAYLTIYLPTQRPTYTDTALYDIHTCGYMGIVHLHPCMHTCIHEYLYIDPCLHHSWIHTCMHAYSHTNMSTAQDSLVHTFMHICRARAGIHMETRVYITMVLTHTYTRMQTFGYEPNLHWGKLRIDERSHRIGINNWLRIHYCTVFHPKHLGHYNVALTQHMLTQSSEQKYMRYSETSACRF